MKKGESVQYTMLGASLPAYFISASAPDTRVLMASQANPTDTSQKDILTNVAILVGHSEESKRPHDYWDRLLGELQPWGVSFCTVAIEDFMGGDKRDTVYPDWSSFDVIIVTSGTVSGAPETKGNLGTDYFQLRGPIDITNWVKDGGILFCENQSQGGKPWQEGYDSIFGSGMVTVMNRDNKNLERYPAHREKGYENLWKPEGNTSARGSVALVSNRHHAHPLVYGVHPFVLSEFAYAGETIIPRHYLPDKRSEFSLFFRCPELLYSGWFVDWAFGWIPILVESETGKWPVLLVRTEEKGAWIASTMRLTSNWCIPLIRNLVNFPVYGEKWQEYHSNTIRRRRMADRVTIGSLISVFVLLMVILWQADILVIIAQWFAALESVISWLLGFSVLGGVFFLVRKAKSFVNRPLSKPWDSCFKRSLH